MKYVAILLFQSLLTLATGLIRSNSFILSENIQRLLTFPRKFVSTLIISSAIVSSSSAGHASTLSIVEDQVINLFQDASPSVVYINTYQDLYQQKTKLPEKLLFLLHLLKVNASLELQ